MEQARDTLELLAATQFAVRNESKQYTATQTLTDADRKRAEQRTHGKQGPVGEKPIRMLVSELQTEHD